MKNISERLFDKINNAMIDQNPSDNFFIEDIFPSLIYSEIIARLPTDNLYNFIDHPDAVLPDGTKTRKLLDLTDETISRFNKDDQNFWKILKDFLISTELQNIILKKFHEKITDRFGNNWPEMVTVPILYRDFPGYQIGIHTDAPYKIATMQFYFPRDRSQIHLGTSFHEKQQDQFRLIKTNPFKPNSAYAFARTETSWHSVKQIAKHEAIRDSLALTIYEKNHEYKSKKYE